MACVLKCKMDYDFDRKRSYARYEIEEKMTEVLKTIYKKDFGLKT